MKAAIALALCAGCSVTGTALEGKQCSADGSCAPGYVCDKPTNRCFPSAGDGGIVDTPSITSCLGGSTTELYRYTGNFVTTWKTSGSGWTGTPSQIAGPGVSAQETYAYTSAVTVNDYRVTVSISQGGISGQSPGYGIVLRATPNSADKNRDTCLWYPNTRELRIESHSGGIDSLLMQTSVTTPGLANLTMEASVSGSTLACCIREISGAHLMNVTSADNATGVPGLETHKAAASFTGFAATPP